MAHNNGLALGIVDVDVVGFAWEQVDLDLCVDFEWVVSRTMMESCITPLRSWMMPSVAKTLLLRIIGILFTHVHTYIYIVLSLFLFLGALVVFAFVLVFFRLFRSTNARDPRVVSVVLVLVLVLAVNESANSSETVRKREGAAIFVRVWRVLLALALVILDDDASESGLCR